uniref:Uncharacterized protein n=1 Tax=Noctiluca scintillans TaxID=2966 RepID=A0A7S0ZYL3_NOCSC
MLPKQARNTQERRRPVMGHACVHSHLGLSSPAHASAARVRHPLLHTECFASCCACTSQVVKCCGTPRFRDMLEDSVARSAAASSPDSSPRSCESPEACGSAQAS